MAVTILKGTIVSAPELGKLDVTEHGYLVAEDGKIVGVFSDLPEQYANAPVEDYGDALILQTFADLHLHGAQYPMLGTGMGYCAPWRCRSAKVCRIRASP